MKEYKVPFGEGEDELVEKKSRFISHIYKITTAAEANELLATRKKEYWDASAIVYAYVLRDGTMRFSDDGEPQGTAGMPTLEMLRKEEINDVLCITVRYFGGTKLGAGGLTRAFGKAAKMALDAAGVAVMQSHVKVAIDCPYNMLEVIRQRFETFEATEDNIEYGASVVFTVYMPTGRFADFSADIIDLTNGTVHPQAGEETMFAKRIK